MTLKLKATEILHAGLDFGGEMIRVGRLALYQHQILFEYDADFVAGGMELSPFRLPVRRGVVTAGFQPFEGLFGVFHDSLPDGWGRLLLDRALTQRGIAYQTLTALDRLAYVGRGGMGALVYYPETSLEEPEEGSLNLNTLADEMSRVLRGTTGDMMEALYRLGGSSAGARPKIVAGYHRKEDRVVYGQGTLPAGYEPWLIKFPSASDQPDIGQVEYAYSLMARAAGLEMTETHLFPGNRKRMYFGTRRFDREGDHRLHMHTASGLLQSSHRLPMLDYDLLMQCALELCKDFREAEKLYRLAAFNVLAHNRDDHGKNFSFLMDAQGKWRFSPVYDLTFSYGPGGEHSTTVMQEGRAPGMQHLQALGEKYHIRDRKQVLEEVTEAVNQWKKYAGEAGVSRAQTAVIQKVIQQQLKA